MINEGEISEGPTCSYVLVHNYKITNRFNANIMHKHARCLWKWQQQAIQH